MNILELLKRVTRKFPDKTAVIENEDHISYTELWRKIDAAAGIYLEQGIKPGDRILMVLPNGPIFLYYFLGALKIGAVAVPVKLEYKTHELGMIVKNCRPSLLVSTLGLPGNSGSLEDFLSPGIPWFPVDGVSLSGDGRRVEILPLGNNELASINYTYFGDGYPKGAALTHGNHIYSANGISKHVGFRGRDRLLAVLPMSHVFTLSGVIMTSIINGSTIVTMTGFSPRTVLSVIERFRISILIAVPAIYELMARYRRKDRYGLSSLHRCVTGGDYMPGDLQREFQHALGTEIVQGYGLTESLPILCNPPGRNKLGTLGLPGRRDIKIKIVHTETDEELDVDQVGEVLVNSPTTMPQYYELPEDSAGIIKDGWLYTGDLGKLDNEGYLHFTGLRKNIFNLYGNKADPLEIERVLVQHPAVENAGIFLEEIPKNSVVGNKRVCANVFVKKDTHISGLDLIEYCKAKMAGYKVPKKIDISQCRERW